MKMIETHNLYDEKHEQMQKYVLQVYETIK